VESAFYAKRRNDTIFFAGLATKKTRLNKRYFCNGMALIAVDQFWCVNIPNRPKVVRIISALLCRLHEE
jgi:hypothetical protein